jgi:hypothetical protein
MTRIADDDPPEPSDLQAKVLDGAGAVVKFPFKLTATLLKHTGQVLLAIFILVLHPQIKWLLKLGRWLLRLLARSPFIRHYITPAVEWLSANLYEPYFAFLAGLPPYWATLSIAVPMALLEPAKFYTMILIVEHPKTGVLLWLLTHGISFLLIDRTWRAVRPQSRKIWLVSRLHAWGWLNYAYGKYWILHSRAYLTAKRWVEEARAAARRLWARLATQQG